MGKKYLENHTGIFTITGMPIFKEKNRYEIIKEDDFAYTTFGEGGERQVFTKEEDLRGQSYKTWFTLIE